jgi:methylmalonyl-CoA mutase
MSDKSNFSPISTQEWMDKVTTDLKGADFEKKLVWRTPEGFNVQPFYRQEDIENLEFTKCLPGEFPYVRGTKAQGNEWYVRQNITVNDAKEANAKALDILYKGVTSIGFCLCKIDLTAENIATLLEGISLDAIEINFSVGGSKTPKLAELFVAYVNDKGYDGSTIIGSINFDPYGKLLKKGTSCTCGNDVAARAKELIEITRGLENFRVITVNAKHFNNAGAYISQELAYGLSMANEYLAKLTEAGIDAWDVAANIKFNSAIGSNYFMELSKFRAGRLLWAKIVESYQPQCKCADNCDCTGECEGGFCKCVAKMIVHAETSMWNKTIYDTHANLLRTQTEAMSASLGGVDSMTVLPFDSAYKPSDEFSERMARNQQLLLKEESHFDRIADVSAGSYYIENLTNSMAEQAWKLFVEVEDKGGFMKALEGGFIQSEVKRSADKRRNAIATRRENLLGTNQFPNFTETKITEVIENKKACGCGCSNDAEQIVEPLVFFRGAEEFEALRLSVEAKEITPKVFLLKTGSIVMRQARAQFSANFFACAGFDIIEDAVFETAKEGAEAALEANAAIVVLCSSDDEYTTAAPEALEALGGNVILVVAGAPACADELKGKGITNFVNVRSNVLEELKRYVGLIK